MIEVMYQLEIKRALVEYLFRPVDGWKVAIDVDAMERCRGGVHPEGKLERVREAETRLLALGATIGAHRIYGRADLVAEHPERGIILVEVEGESSRQAEQAMYSALGQLMLQCRGGREQLLLALPDGPKWELQARKLPSFPREQLRLGVVLVSAMGVRAI